MKAGSLGGQKSKGENPMGVGGISSMVSFLSNGPKIRSSGAVVSPVIRTASSRVLQTWCVSVTLQADSAWGATDGLNIRTRDG